MPHALERLAGLVVPALAVEPHGLLLGALGEQPGDHAVHVAVPGLGVVHGVVRVRPGGRDRLQRGPRPIERPVPIRDPDERPDLPSRLAEVEGEPEHDRQHLARHHVAQEHVDPATALLDAERRQRLDSDGLGQDELQDHLAGDDLEGLPHLARDVVPHLDHVADEVEVAAAGIRHALEQGLVEVRADPERAGRDPPAPQVVGPPDELVAIRDPDVGEAVGQEQDAVDALGPEAAGDLVAAGEPAAVEVRAPPRVDRPEAVLRELPRLRRGEDAAHDDVHLVVVDDGGEPVRRLQAMDGLEHGLLGQAELVLAAHRARAVQHEGEVDGRAPAAGVRGDGGRDDVHEQEPLAAAVGADVAAVRADAQRGVHERELDPVVGVGGHGGPPLRMLVERPGWGGSRVRIGRGARIRCPRRTARARSARVARRACWRGGPAGDGRGAPRPR